MTTDRARRELDEVLPLFDVRRRGQLVRSTSWERLLALGELKLEVLDGQLSMTSDQLKALLGLLLEVLGADDVLEITGARPWRAALDASQGNAPGVERDTAQHELDSSQSGESCTPNAAHQRPRLRILSLLATGRQAAAQTLAAAAGWLSPHRKPETAVPARGPSGITAPCRRPGWTAYEKMTREGLLPVPAQVRHALGLPAGGWLAFFVGEQGQIQVLSKDEYRARFGEGLDDR